METSIEKTSKVTRSKMIITPIDMLVHKPNPR